MSKPRGGGCGRNLTLFLSTCSPLIGKRIMLLLLKALGPAALTLLVFSGMSATQETLQLDFIADDDARWFSFQPDVFAQLE